MTNQDIIVTGYAIIMLLVFFIVKIGLLYLLMLIMCPKD